MLNIAGGILFSRVGCDDDVDEEDEGEKKDVLRRATSLRTLPHRSSRGASPVAAGPGGRGSPFYRVGSLRAYNRAVLADDAEFE